MPVGRLKKRLLIKSFLFKVSKKRLIINSLIYDVDDEVAVAAAAAAVKLF